MTEAMKERESVLRFLQEKHDYHLAKAEQAALNTDEHWFQLQLAAKVNGLKHAIERGDHQESDQ